MVDFLPQGASLYLPSRKPEVPSGPVGCRITWLFGRTCSDGCWELKRAGLSWLGLSWGVSSEEALPKILRRASAYSASRWAKDFICWGRVEDAAFPAVPLFEGRFKILICGGGAAGRESSWITIAVRTGEPAEPKLDFFASWFIFNFASSLLSISPLSAASSQLSATSSSSMFNRTAVWLPLRFHLLAISPSTQRPWVEGQYSRRKDGILNSRLIVNCGD